MGNQTNSQIAEGIEITNQWFQELMQHPFVSKRTWQGNIYDATKIKRSKREVSTKSFNVKRRLSNGPPEKNNAFLCSTSLRLKSRIDEGLMRCIWLN